jgi:hypothetical protein
MDYLIQKNILTQKHGNYKSYAGDKKIVITGSYGNARGKTRYLTDPLYNQLLISKLQDNINNYFQQRNFIYSQQYTAKQFNKTFSFDYVVYEDNTQSTIKLLIEFYNEQKINQDKINYCNDNNIRLIRIKYDQVNHIEEIFKCVS